MFFLGTHKTEKWMFKFNVYTVRIGLEITTRTYAVRILISIFDFIMHSVFTRTTKNVLSKLISFTDTKGLATIKNVYLRS